MIENSEIYEETFAKSDKTDAILVLDGKKLHVNKALLSYHSDYFNTLFNSDFKEKSMEEIPIEDVNFEDFATVLSFAQANPLTPTEENVENLLELAERFLLPVAKRHVELFLMSSRKERLEKIRLADKYQLDGLLKHTIKTFTYSNDFYGYGTNPTAQGFSDRTKVQLYTRLLETMGY